MPKLDLQDILNPFLAQLTTIAQNADTAGIDFVRTKADKLKVYTTKLAQKKLTKLEYQSLVKGEMIISLMEFDKLSVQAKAKAEKMINALTEAVIDGVFKLIKL